MEEYSAITYENLILGGYQAQHILALEMTGAVNRHGTLHLTAVIPEEKAEEYVYRTGPKYPVVLGSRTENGETQILFRGVVTDIRIDREGDVCQMELYVLSNTSVMDVVKRYRSFQHPETTVHGLIREVVSGYENSDCIIRIRDEPVGRLLVQYGETDWEFLQRFVSHYGAALIADVTGEKTAFSVGLDPQGEAYPADGRRYTVVKSLQTYRSVKENRWPDVTELDFTVFRLEDVRIFRIGDCINLSGKTLHVELAASVLRDGILCNTYSLKRKEGMKGLEIFHTGLVGASLTGCVAGVARDRILVDLEVDEPGRAAYWFPYSTMSASPDGSGWYCMPEKGDRVGVYFPTCREEDAYAVSAVSAYQPAPGDTKDPMADPGVKYLKTKKDQEIRFIDDGVVINSGDGMATLYLKNDGSLMVYGSQNVNITAREKLSLISKGDLVLGAKESVTVKKGEGTSITLQKDGNIKLKGTKILSN